MLLYSSNKFHYETNISKIVDKFSEVTLSNVIGSP